MFQFPSNGKVYPKRSVVIKWMKNIKMFQFPSNGKVYPKASVRECHVRFKLGFNSLQTGRCIQRKNIKIAMAIFIVSIPFKREGVSKVEEKDWRKLDFISKFQFPSNGKVYPKYIYFQIEEGCGDGFNSLQTGRCIQRYWSAREFSLGELVKFLFQFPSNGKVYPKCFRWDWRSQSEEFQFPSNGKVYPKCLEKTTLR